MKTHEAIVLISFLFILKGCDGTYVDKRYSIFLKNESNNSVEAIIPIGEGLYYPDTTLQNLNNLVTRKVEASSKLGIISGSTPWEDRFPFLPKDTLSMYIFHPDTLSAYSWDEVRAGYKVLKRYDLSIEDLQALDYEVVYPPTQEMADIRQYPPYE